MRTARKIMKTQGALRRWVTYLGALSAITISTAAVAQDNPGFKPPPTPTSANGHVDQAAKEAAEARAAKPTASASAAPAASASAKPASSIGPVDPNAPLPANHPGADPNDPHGHGGHDSDGMSELNGVFKPPPDAVKEDPTLPAGTLVLHFEDAKRKAIGGFEMKLAIVENSIANGDSRSYLNRTVGADGTVRFDGLGTKSNLAYRVSVLRDGATYALPPFRMPEKGGMDGVLHVYPVSRELSGSGAIVASKADVYLELKDDRVQFEENISIYNFGEVTWVPQEVVIALPEGFTAVSAGEQMSDIGIDPVEGKGVRLKGTFGPGPHDLTFRYQMPYGGGTTLSAHTGLPPHAVSARVITPSGGGLTLDVRGYPRPQVVTGDEGLKFLVTEKEFQQGEPLDDGVELTVGGLPGDSLAAKIVTGVSVLLVIAAAIAFRRRGDKAIDPRQLAAEKTRILDDLVALEAARREGIVGPKNYERERRERLSTLARILALLDASVATKP